MTHIQWHPAFVAAVREALRDAPPEAVEVIPELALSSKPLDVDILVVKKSEAVRLGHPIARFFRRYNLFEYKSPAPGIHAVTEAYFPVQLVVLDELQDPQGEKG